jgi:hypothetical protein
MLEPMQRCDELAALLAHNHRLQAILSRAPELELDAYYLAAGAIVQTVWNVQSSRPADAGIDDYDLVYEEHFGNAIEPYRSVEHAIDTFPTIVTSIGVRRNANASLHVYAPFGLTDLFAAIVRPNKRQITRTIYDRKVARWTRIWPHLEIVPW